MTSTCLFSDIVLPAATWYKKHDLSTTDMHPFVHSFNPAIAPPVGDPHGLRRLPHDRQGLLPAGRQAPRCAPGRDGGAARPTTPPTSWRSPGGRVQDWKNGECDPGLGQDHAEAGRGSSATTGAVAGEDERDRATAGHLGHHHQGHHLRSRTRSWRTCRAPSNGVVRTGIAAGRAGPTLDRHMCEAILALSGTTNGRLAVAGVARTSSVVPA